ncbi:MAG TPA: gamma-glutamyl-gamma-aminobutyrate hydrolase family protein [Phycisphaerae bacterium]|nr:gamma-glutamyl-gamma-aminobutyrate hydrolase family protein [Phycisphaerae bacterium]
MRPCIGLTCQYLLRKTDDRRIPHLALNAAYFDAVTAAGGLPLALPPCQEPDQIEQLLNTVDALIFTGGRDILPERLGQTLHPKSELMHPRRDSFEFELFARADRLHLPILAICLGCQLVNVARGGTIHQHLYDAPRACQTDHGKAAHRSMHPVSIDPDCHLARIVQATQIEANSSHHQSVDRPGRNLRIVAKAPDGIIEAVEDPDRPFLVAVQWHPEDMPDNPVHMALFRELIHAAQRHQR